MFTGCSVLLALATISSWLVGKVASTSNDQWEPSATKDSCQLQRTGATGQCRLLSDCPHVVTSLLRNPPTICGIIGMETIVCCPLIVSANPASNSASDDEESLVSVSKCRSYESAVSEKQSVQLFGEYKVAEIAICNMVAMPLIESGAVASPGEFPHMAIFGYEDKRALFCAGSLISENFVLTAAHCLVTSSGPPSTVHLGVLSKEDGITLNQPDRSQSISIADIHPHPDYNQQASMYNDIGLVRLQQSVRMTPFIRPACLPAFNDVDRTIRMAVLSGWGRMTNEDSVSDRLRKVCQEMFTTAECNSSYTGLSELSHGIDGQTQLCAGSRTVDRDICIGHSGAPLQIQHPDQSMYCMYQIVGVGSTGGMPCGRVNSSTIYTRISAYLPWVEQLVWPRISERAAHF